MINMKYLGEISATEAKVISDLVHWVNGIKECLPVITSENERIEIVKELQEAERACFEWWHTISCKYGWEYKPSDRWHVDLKCNKVYLLPTLNMNVDIRR